jgi:hypothetical protein
VLTTRFYVPVIFRIVCLQTKERQGQQHETAMDNYRDMYCNMPQGVATELPISIHRLHILLPIPLGAGTEGESPLTSIYC